MRFSTYDRELAGEGLGLVFKGEIVGIVSALVAAMLVFVAPLLGIVGVIAMLVGTVMCFVGTYRAAPAHPKFRTAWELTLVSIIPAVVGNFAGDGLISMALGLAGIVLGFLRVYYTCMASRDLLEEIDGAQAEKAENLVKIYLVSVILSGVVTLLGQMGITLGLLDFASAAVDLVVGVLYLVFLYKTSKSLLEG